MGSVEESRSERVRHHDLVGPINRGDTNEQALIVEVKERTTASCGRFPANEIWFQCLSLAKFLHLYLGREEEGVGLGRGCGRVCDWARMARVGPPIQDQAVLGVRSCVYNAGALLGNGRWYEKFELPDGSRVPKIPM
jgi:hypothetical protein